jgi:hypothetical protein
MKNKTAAALLALALLATLAYGFSKAQDSLASLQADQTTELEATINGDY